MKQYHRVYAEINLSAIVHNMESMRACIPSNTGIIGVVKTDGYGHGAVPVAKTIAPYVTSYAVATVEEALQLRRHGIDQAILVLGVVHESSYSDLISYEIRPTIFQLEKAEAFSRKACEMGKIGYIHLGVDTGMSRIGMLPNEESADVVEQIAALSGIEIEGIFTHFAQADETDKAAANLQRQKFKEFLSMLKKRNISIPIHHCANSAGIVEDIGTEFDMVRAGISIYGLYPSAEVAKDQVILVPAMELKSAVTCIKTIEAGTPVSYGATFTADKRMTIATVPIGYGDGYPRGLSNKGSVLIHGRRANILGRICMDQMMIDVTNMESICEGDIVTLIGKDGENQISVEELAELCGGFHYEILCNITKRVPRIYKKNDRMIATKDYFDDIYSDFIQ